MKKSMAVLSLLLATTFLQAVSVNDPAPPFALTNQHQQRRTFAGYKGKVLFINFWASWCGPCQLELPELNRLASGYKGKKVKVLVINVDQERGDAEKLLAKLGLQAPAFEVIWDNHAKAVNAYNIDAMPSSFVIDPRGIIRFVHSGFHMTDPAEWRKEIDGLLTAIK
jgi:thiol-disulfide isomerase/thioredoxin